MTDKVNRARISISPEFLQEYLYLPETARVYGAHWDFAGDSLVLFVDDPQLPAVQHGSIIPLMKPKYTRQEPLIFDWDIKQILDEIIS